MQQVDYAESGSCSKWVMLQVDHIASGSCSKWITHLSLGYNVIAIGWLRLTRFCGVDNEAYEEASSKIANLFIDEEVFLY